MDRRLPSLCAALFAVTFVPTAHAVDLTPATALVAGANAAGTAMGTPTLKDMDADELLAFHARLAREMRTRKYDYLDNGDREQIGKSQERIRSALSGGRSLDELNEQQRLVVFNAHQHVVATVNEAELDRVVCKRQHQLGSHRPKLLCQTERERRLIAERQRNELIYNDTCGGGEGCN